MELYFQPPLFCCFETCQLSSVIWNPVFLLPSQLAGICSFIQHCWKLNSDSPLLLESTVLVSCPSQPLIHLILSLKIKVTCFISFYLYGCFSCLHACMYVCLYVHHLCSVQQGQKKGIESPRTGVRLLWVSCLSPLVEYPVLLKTRVISPSPLWKKTI